MRAEGRAALGRLLLDRYRLFWEDALDALARHVEERSSSTTKPQHSDKPARRPALPRPTPLGGKPFQVGATKAMVTPHRDKDRQP